jgi:hypothetical protein
MREQNRLREQMEDAARQSNDGQSRGIADQMRQAAGELQRQNTDAAAERAGQAASGLRRLEEQMRDGGAARTAGEMSLEGQQIADEQRRIAGEAARLAKGPAGADQDAWRRLAGEQETLADRLDHLKQRAQDASAGQKPAAGEGTQASAAAREIERQQLGSRMRDSARQMRADDPPPAKPGRASATAAAPKPAPKPTGEAEQQIARALDQIVEQLGGRPSERAEDLSRGLDQAQAIRERLDRMERTLREAEARPGATPPSTGRSGAPAGRNGEAGQAAGRSGGADVQQLREQYAKEVQRAREELSRMERSTPGAGHAGATPEGHEWSVTDQGKEAFKQDFSGWSSLRKDLDSALERFESAIVARAARRSLDDRLSVGGSERVPDAYRALIARYYESLARKTQK